MISTILLVLVAVGLAQALAGLNLLRRFAAAPRPAPTTRPPVSILKPLHGAEPWLDWALSTMAGQDYPGFQIVCGVAAADDAAISAVRTVQARYPDRDITLVICADQHGSNAKVSNLINMFPSARHDIIVISDSDVHAATDWLDRVVAALQAPDVGMVTTLYSGLATVSGLVARLGAMQICHAFLPGAAMARALGRQDGLGATMALRRDTLERVGGLQRMANTLADDAMLGILVRQLGLRVALAHTLPAVGVPENTLRALWKHELRWARTVRSIAPAAHAASALQYPLVPALIALLTAPMSQWGWLVFLGTWLARAEIARRTDTLIGGFPTLAAVQSVRLWPVRDLMSVAVIAVSFTGRDVDWRGKALRADPVVADIISGKRGTGPETPSSAV